MTPDEQVVARQIRRPPRGMERVEARCAYGYPTVISVAPLVPGRRGRPALEPFPTRFWLTCPILVEQVSRLEAAGGVVALEEEAAADPALDALLREDHARYAAERFAAADAEARERAAAGGTLPVLRDTGVGGIRDHGHLKCLHAQYAFHLARGSAVGRILAERHGLRECAPSDVRCDAFRYGA